MKNYQSDYNCIKNLAFVRQRVPMFVGEFAKYCYKFNKKLLSNEAIDKKTFIELENLVSDINHHQRNEDINNLLAMYMNIINN